MINHAQATAFLQQLGDGPFIFQTFTDNKIARTLFKKNRFGKPVDPLAKVLVGDFETHKNILEALSKKGAGIFVQVNLGSRRGKDAVKKIRAIFMDFDDPATSKKSIAAAVAHLPKPSMMVKSSKGKYHMYWSVTDCPVDQFSSIQQQMAVKFLADTNIKNLDRVMRLPGFPHQKLETQPVEAMIAGKSYTLKQVYDAAANAPMMATVGNHVITDVFGLDIAEAYVEPDVLEPGNRTAKLVSHIGKMISDGYSAEAIRKKIIKMNVELCAPGAQPIDSGVLEYEVLGCIDKFIAERHADTARERTISGIAPPPPPPLPAGEATIDDIIKDTSQAREDAVYAQVVENEDTLDEWLDRFCYVEEDSRVVDTRLAGAHAIFKLSDFKNKTQNIKVGGKAFLSKKWLECTARKSFRDTVYIPKQTKTIEVNGTSLWNIYTPSNLKPADKLNVDKVQPFLMHMEYFFPVKSDRELFLNWFAFSVVKQEIRIPWAPLIISQPGAGKGLIYEVLRTLLGSHNTVMIQPDRFESQFNSFMSCNTMVCVDEMKTSKKFGISEKLKSYISERNMEINTKNVAEGSQDIYCNFIFFTNHHNAAHIEEGDRRFWVHQVDGLQSPVYYKEMWNWARTTENMSHLLSWCLARDLSKFNHAEPPPTSEAKTDMIYASRGDLESLVKDALEARDGPFAADVLSYQVVSNYITAQLQTPINGAIANLLRHIWGSVSKPLANVPGQVRAFDVDGLVRHRPRSVRNTKYWRAQSIDDVRHELTRSIQMLLKKEVDSPRLTEAK
ncbi:MAG: hypothetical protein ACI9EP_001751 [Oceanospirillaceae bacterium]|jgi:hypothetical protein